MNIIQQLFFLIICFLACNTATKSIYIIIHGTWASTSQWYIPGGDFFDTFTQQNTAYDAHTVSFTWSGKNNHESRIHAAHQLIYLINSYEPTTEIHLIAHSHGANVGILASQLLAQQHADVYRIATFYALGAPVTHDYTPAMNVIYHFYNCFSFGDYVQSIGGLFKRLYPSHERIANIRITIDGKDPTHSDLHHYTIARWLTCIEHITLLPDTETLFFTHPCRIDFSETSPPLYTIDHERNKLIIQDRIINQAFLSFLTYDRYQCLIADELSEDTVL